MSAIYKMNLDCGRAGNLEGIFIADKSKVDQLIETKQVIHFGEVLGKHSDVETYVTNSEIKMVSDDDHVLQLFEKLGMQCGFNPFDYIEEDGE